MRIAIVNWSRRKAGGIETYLNTVIPELDRAGHELAFWHEVDVPAEREPIELPQDAPSWCVAELGKERAVAALRDWQPDVIYSHKVEDPELEAATLGVAPSVYFAHDYQGMCISGTRTFKFPTIKPCGRDFDRQCLAHYFPHRCGGLSPLTMLKHYRLQSKRQELLHRYNAIVTHSEHMLSELIKHGLPAHQAYSFPYYVQRAGVRSRTNGSANGSHDAAADSDALQETPEPRARPYWHLVFSGRMELLKGGQVLLDALPRVVEELEKPIRVTFAGDGRARSDWKRKAAYLQQRHADLDIEFIGWALRAQIDALLADCDLLVVPSLWPEPFGLVGPEAGLKGVPVAAFAVGGISDWLEDGVNGHLAPGDPPTVDGLAEAIIRCLRDPLAHARLRARATVLAERFSIKNHITALLEVFQSVAKN